MLEEKEEEHETDDALPRKSKTNKQISFADNLISKDSETEERSMEMIKEIADSDVEVSQSVSPS